MIVYRCDLCGEVRDCSQREIESTEYDICAECWTGLTAKLQGKGRPLKPRQTIALPALPQSPSPAPEIRPPFRERPVIIADSGVH
jgi:hypothetical protein